MIHFIHPIWGAEGISQYSLDESCCYWLKKTKFHDGLDLSGSGSAELVLLCSTQQCSLDSSSLYHHETLFGSCRLGCSTAFALWPATTRWACSALERGSASCWRHDTFFPSKSSSGVRLMITWWWDVLMAQSTSGRWTQVRNSDRVRGSSCCKMIIHAGQKRNDNMRLCWLHHQTATVG